MTGRASLLGSIQSVHDKPAPTAILSNQILMETAGKSFAPKHESDEQNWSRLMVNAQAGNESDYRQLLTELTDVIFNFLRSRFGDHHFIEDCVQETLMAIHQARHTYDQHRPFRAWFFAIVRNKAIDTLRKQSTRQKITNQYQGEQEIFSPKGRHSEAESEMIKGRLLESLSVQHREVLTLTKIIGFSVAETAEKLGISESLVKVRVHRAIRKLKKFLETDTL